MSAAAYPTRTLLRNFGFGILRPLEATELTTSLSDTRPCSGIRCLANPARSLSLRVAASPAFLRHGDMNTLSVCPYIPLRRCFFLERPDLWTRQVRGYAKKKIDAKTKPNVDEEEVHEEEDEESYASAEQEDDGTPREYMELKVSVSSPRYDNVLKGGIKPSLNREAIDVAFVENRVRVNGERVFKKGNIVALGDVIDIIQRVNPQNPDFLDVTRVIVDELSDAKTKNKLILHVRSWKHLMVENYKGANKYSFSDTKVKSAA